MVIGLSQTVPPSELERGGSNSFPEGRVGGGALHLVAVGEGGPRDSDPPSNAARKLAPGEVIVLARRSPVQSSPIISRDRRSAGRLASCFWG